MRWRHPILVLDADPEGGQQAAEILVANGLEVEVMTLPEQLLQRAAAHPSTVMMVEVPLKGMSETVLLSTAQRMTGLKVMPIILTSRTYPEDGSVAKSLLAQGAVDFIGRPASSQRWRAALAKALAKLQTESAKLASLQKKRSSTHTSGEFALATVSGEFSIPPDVYGESSPDLLGRRRPSEPTRSDESLGPRPRSSGSRGPRPGNTAAEVLRPDERSALKEKGFIVPREAIAGQPLGKRRPPSATLVWRASEVAMTIACLEHTHADGAEVRIVFTIPDKKTGREARPRILGRVVESRGYAWGSLVKLALIGAAPKADYDLLVESVKSSGGWSVDWKNKDWDAL